MTKSIISETKEISIKIQTRNWQSKLKKIRERNHETFLTFFLFKILMGKLKRKFSLLSFIGAEKIKFPSKPFVHTNGHFKL